jgi:hypothetical protein
MLALDSWFAPPPCDPIDESQYADFSFDRWVALMVDRPNREEKAHDLLRERLKITLYWPHYTTQVCFRGRSHKERKRSVLPGIMLMPCELKVSTSADWMAWAGLRLVSFGRIVLTKQEVELIRDMEAKLQARFDKKIYNFEIGQRVGFKSPLWSSYLVEGEVLKLASQGRISIKVREKLIGGIDVLDLPAAELVPM